MRDGTMILVTAGHVEADRCSSLNSGLRKLAVAAHSSIGADNVTGLGEVSWHQGGGILVD
jgi:hypothetical protein